jgi:two-component system, cell cycle response regulator
LAQGDNGDSDDLPDEDDFGEDRTAIVNLADLRSNRRRAAKDRHLLVRVHGSQLGQVIALRGQPVRIGRQQDCDVWLDDGGISRRHAQVVPALGGYTVEDLGSANGTFVQGQRVERQQLRDGDLIQFGPTVVFRYSVTDEEHEGLLKQLYAASVTDSLTGAYNREHLESRLQAELSYARRHKSEVSLVMFDIDHFKAVNDTYGHPAGDAVLIAVSSAVARALRNEDVFARYGGEEFAIILRNIDRESARRVGERIRLCVASLKVRHAEHVLGVTISVGCAAMTELPDPSTDGLIALADRRLYAAKHGGRNRVVAAD